VVAGIELRPQPFGVVSIACGSFKIDDAVISSAGANPVIDSFADRFAALSGGTGSLVRRQSAADDLDTECVRPLDDLFVTADQILRGGASAAFEFPLPISLMPSSTITHFTPDWLSTSRSILANALAPVPSRSTRLPPIPILATARFAVSLFAANLALSTVGQLRLVSGVERKLSVMEIAQSDYQRHVRRRQHVDAGEPIIRLRVGRIRNRGLAAEIAFLRDVGRMQTVMRSRSTGLSGEVETHRDIAKLGDTQVNRVAQDCHSGPTVQPCLPQK